MDVKSRKKRLYRHLLRATKHDCQRSDQTVAGNSRAWRLIKADALRVFEHNYTDAWEWFTTPALAFNGMQPADLVRAGDLQFVRNHLIKMEYCVYI